MSADWKAAAAAADGITRAWAADQPGGVVLLFDREGLRHEARGGLASLPHGIPFTAATPARYASITKHVFCAFALSQGADLSRPLGALLPDLPAPLAAVPGWRALAMTGGLPDLMQTYGLLGVPHTAALAGEALDRFTRLLPGLDSAPGEELSYSNTGYRLVEEGLARQGLDFGAWIARVNAALGIGFAYPGGWDVPVPRLADGYWREGEGAPWRTGAYGMALSASGALAGSALDLMRWTQALLRGEGPAGGVLARLATPSAMADGRPTGYGLGLALRALGGRRLAGHGGSLTGFKNHVLFDLDSGAGVVLLSNREETEPLPLTLRVLAALWGEALPPTAPALLPEGLFVEADGPAWIEHRAGSLTYLGAKEALHEGGDGWAVSISPYLPIRLRREGDGIAGEIGHRARRFLPVPPDAALPAGLDGLWRAEGLHGELRIAGGRAGYGAGPLHREAPLVPLGGGRALMPVGAAPWPSRACLWLRSPDALRVVTNRSRVVEFRRAG